MVAVVYQKSGRSGRWPFGQSVSFPGYALTKGLNA